MQVLADIQVLVNSVEMFTRHYMHTYICDMFKSPNEVILDSMELLKGYLYIDSINKYTIITDDSCFIINS